MTLQHSRPSAPSIRGALLGDLDNDTRRYYGLAEFDEPASDGAPRRGFAGLVQIVRQTINQITEDRVMEVAGGVTFFSLLALFPAITAFVSLYGVALDPERIPEHMASLTALLPTEVVAIIEGQVVAIANAPGRALSLAGLVGLTVALYSANGGMKALLSALNVALFQRESRSFLQLNLIAMCFTLAGLFLIAVMLVTIAVVPIALRWLPVATQTELMVSMIRWPILMALLVMALAALYRWGPARPQRKAAGPRPIMPGAILTALLLVSGSMLFSWYTANFANYNRTYGTLGAVIALMMWMWLSACIVLGGAELNAVLGRRRQSLDAPPEGAERA